MPMTLADFVHLCDLVASKDGIHEKIVHLKLAFSRCDDPKLLCKLLLPQCDARIYGIQAKQLAHFYSKILNLGNVEFMNDSFESTGDPSMVAYRFHTLLEGTARESSLSLSEVDEFLDEMHVSSDKFDKLYSFMMRCTPDDMRIVIRLLNRNLKINAGPRFVLGAISENAYTAYTLTKDLNLALNGETSNGGTRECATIAPMLAAQWRSMDQPFAKFPNGVLSEIKYDGERVQIHGNGGEFTFYTRTLKRVQDKKIESVVDHVKLAFPKNVSIIVDSEILMIDRETGEFLPFGTLGVHKRKQFNNAQVCLVLFDCMHYNGENLCARPLHERRAILELNIAQIDKRIILSEQKLVCTAVELRVEFEKALATNKEGLMSKSSPHLNQSH